MGIKIRPLIVAVLVGLCALLVATPLAAWLLQRRAGIVVVVENAGTAPVRLVTVHVTGDVQSLGDLAPGTRTAVGVRPSGESHVELTFLDEAGAPRRIDAGGFFEPGFWGEIRLTLRDGRLVENVHSVRVW